MDELVDRVRQDNLTYLDDGALRDLQSAAARVGQEGIPGDVIEAGCALGGSAIVLAASKPADRALYVYDVFGMIPAPGPRDGSDVHARYDEISSGRSRGLGGEAYYGYRSELLEEVRDNFRRFGCAVEEHDVHLVQGLFEDTLHPAAPVALAHVDGDWYDSVTVCLERIWPWLSPGGRVVIDDYEHWSGCRTAVDDFTRPREDVERVWENRLHLVKSS